MTLQHQTTLAFGVLSTAVVAALLAFFHDRFWWPVDEGVYAYVAQRILAGDRLHLDLIDLHGGYGNMINVLAFRLFGEDLLSLRYPLVAATFVQSAIGYTLLSTRGQIVASAAAIGIASLSFIQFLNPSANWHALLFFFVMSFVLSCGDNERTSKMILIGLVIGLCFFTRQLSGVFLALGSVCLLLLQHLQDTRGPRAPAICAAAIMALGLALYLISKGSVFGAIWAGLWPLTLIACIAARVRITWRDATQMFGSLAVGMAIGMLPLATHHYLNGTLRHWGHDIFFTSLLINGQDFISTSSYTTLLKLSALNVMTGAGAVPALSALAWTLLILMVPAVGALTAIGAVAGQSPRPIPVLATFWALVALHYQIPIYLLFAVPALTLAILDLRPRLATAAAVTLVAAWSVCFQAGQPLSRGIAGIVASKPGEAQIPAELPRVSLCIAESDAVVFRALVDVIDREARPDEPLMTLPMEPELNFITARRAPVPFYGTPLGLRTLDDVEATTKALDEAAPLFVVNRREDKYLTPLSNVLLEVVRRRSSPPRAFGPFDLYRYQGLKAVLRQGSPE